MDRKTCYGKMMPDPSSLDPNHRLDGKAFLIELHTSGLAVDGRNVSVKDAEWEDYLVCSDHQHCWQLSVGKQHLAPQFRLGS